MNIKPCRSVKNMIRNLAESDKEIIYNITESLYKKIQSQLDKTYVENCILYENEIRIYPKREYENENLYSYICLIVTPNYKSGLLDRILNIFLTVNKEELLKEFHETKYKIYGDYMSEDSYENLDNFINVHNYVKFYGTYNQSNLCITELKRVLEIIHGIIRENENILDENSAEKILQGFKRGENDEN